MNYNVSYNDGRNYEDMTADSLEAAKAIVAKLAAKHFASGYELHTTDHGLAGDGVTHEYIVELRYPIEDDSWREVATITCDEERILTDGGEYTVVKELKRFTTDMSIGLCIGRAADGHHDLIATDNSSNWLVGDPDDAERNYNQFSVIEDAGAVIDIDAIRAVDAALADYIADRQQAAEDYESDNA